jgi:peptidoglycan/LPS O-acetylase OafA/YrhL
MEAVVLTQCTRWGKLGVFLMRAATGLASTVWAGVAFEVQQSKDVFMVSVLWLWWYSILFWYTVGAAIDGFPILRNECADHDQPLPVYSIFITFVYLTMAFLHAVLQRGWARVRWFRCATVAASATLVVVAPVVTGNWSIHSGLGSALLGMLLGGGFVVMRLAFLEPYYLVLLQHPLAQWGRISYSEDSRDKWFF